MSLCMLWQARDVHSVQSDLVTGAQHKRHTKAATAEHTLVRWTVCKNFGQLTNF